MMLHDCVNKMTITCAHMHTYKLSDTQLWERLGLTGKHTSQAASTTSTGMGINREEKS